MKNERRGPVKLLAQVAEHVVGGGGADAEDGRHVPLRVQAETLRVHAAVEVDGLAVLAESCMLAGAAAAGVQAILPKENGLQGAMAYLKQVPGVIGGVVFLGERIGMAGGLELAA